LKKILFIVFDGIADLPIPELGDRTPLEVAKTPNLDTLAKVGVVGTQNALAKGEYPTSEEAHFEILGYDHKKDLPGRGVMEALGIGVQLKKGELALRVNFATVDDSLNVIDPRAGNLKDNKDYVTQIAEEKINQCEFKLYSGLAHRAVLVMSGRPVSSEIKHHSTIVNDTDPHKATNHRGGNKVIKPIAIGNSLEAKITAEALWKYQLLTHAKLNNYIENKVRRRQGLPVANFLLTRGAGYIKSIDNFYNKFGLNAACVAGAPLYKGIASYFGMDVIEVPGATGGTDTDVFAKVNRSLELFESGYDFVFLHFKGADVVAEEDGDYESKIKFFEKADQALLPLLDFEGVTCITGDHATPCILKDHSPDPVPILIVGNKRDEITDFNERTAPKGALGHLKGSEIMPKLMKEANYV
jgi:2,3-bisphosphoglycerate-independent phosphoglycerate mutase